MQDWTDWGPTSWDNWQRSQHCIHDQGYPGMPDNSLGGASSGGAPTDTISIPSQTTDQVAPEVTSTQNEEPDADDESGSDDVDYEYLATIPPPTNVHEAADRQLPLPHLGMTSRFQSGND